MTNTLGKHICQHAWTILTNEKQFSTPGTGSKLMCQQSGQGSFLSCHEDNHSNYQPVSKTVALDL